MSGSLGSSRVRLHKWWHRAMLGHRQHCTTGCTILGPDATSPHTTSTDDALSTYCSCGTTWHVWLTQRQKDAACRAFERQCRRNAARKARRKATP